MTSALDNDRARHSTNDSDAAIAIGPCVGETLISQRLRMPAQHWLPISDGPPDMTDFGLSRNRRRVGTHKQVCSGTRLPRPFYDCPEGPLIPQNRYDHNFRLVARLARGCVRYQGRDE